MRVGFFSPFPPAATGVADYSAALFYALCKRGDVRRADASAEVALYHLGNNGLHAEIYERALSHPGVIVLHDAVLHHFLLGHLSNAQYEEEFVYNYGEWARGLAAELWRQRAKSGVDARYFEHPMLRRIVERSRAVIVHNPAAAASVRKHVPEANVEEIPHLFVEPKLPAASGIAELRSELGVAPGELLAGIFGYLRESKRVTTVIRAWRKARPALRGGTLLLAGRPASSDLARMLAQFAGEPGIVIRPYLPEPEFWKCAAASDVVVNLRYPAAGETSGIAIRLMGIGKCVMVSDSPEVARWPSTACLRVDAGLAEEELLTAYFLWLGKDRGAAEEIGRAAAEYVREHHSIERAAEQYWRVLSEAAARSR